MDRPKKGLGKGAMMDQAAQQAESTPEGKAAVKALLLDRLEGAGFGKPKKMGAEAFEGQKKFLAERLAYMSPDNLLVLAESLISDAASNDWPSEIIIMQRAKVIQSPPPATTRAMSWLVSVEGPKAVAGGYLVDLYRFIKGKLRPPGSPYEMGQLRERSVENARRCQIIRERIRAGGCGDDDRAWLQTWLADEQAALDLVDEGNRKRVEAARVAAEQAGAA
jgi:hypothetical protein